MKKIKYLFLFLPFFIAAQITGKVIKVKDGDTIVVLDADKKQHTIRVADIDCPEKKQPFGSKAKWFVSDLIFSKEVYIKRKSIDRYGRIVGYVLFDDKDLSAELLKNGLAWHYVRYSDSKIYEELEKIARSKKIGIWSHSDFIAPWFWREKN